MAMERRPMTDLQLIRDYQYGSHDALAQIVHRYIDLVYSSAIRQVRDPGLAEDVTQAVFLILSKKAGILHDDAVLPAWLLKTTYFAARDATRMRRRRQFHEQKAAEMASQSTGREPSEWNEISVVLDRAMAQLNSRDRDVLVLRYWNNYSVGDIATSLKISENATSKRISRALSTLEKMLRRQGVRPSGLGVALERQVVMSAPAGLNVAISGAIKASSVSSAAAMISDSAARSLAWAHAKLLACWLAAAVAIAGSIVFVAQQVSTSSVAATAPTSQVASSSPAALPARVLKFPDDRAVGILGVRDITIPHEHWWEGWRDIARARGPVQIPAGHIVHLRVNPEGQKDLSFLKQLAPGSLHWININQGKTIDDAALHNFDHLTALAILDLEQCPITDEGLKTLSNLQGLESLSIAKTSIRGTGFADFANKRLKSLLISDNPKITLSGLQSIGKINSLEHLTVFRTPMKDAALAELTSLSQLKTLNLSQGVDVTAAGLKSIAAMKGLEQLELNYRGKDEHALSALSQLKSLKELILFNNAVGDAVVHDIAQIKSLEELTIETKCSPDSLQELAHLPHLKSLRLNSQLTDAHVVALADASNLETINILGKQLTDAGMDAVAKMMNLKTLWIQTSAITDAGFAKLSGLTNLEMLFVGQTRMTGAGLAPIANFKKLKGLIIEADYEKGNDRMLGCAKYIRDLTNLESLSLEGAVIDDSEMSNLDNLKKLQYLRIDHAPITDAGVTHIGGLQNLTFLMLYGDSRMTDEALASISLLKKLESIQMTGEFTDNGLQYLEGMPNLSYVGLTGRGLSDAAIERLQKRTPAFDDFHKFDD
jgi:RNA polymerase sigma factor (sigma-70 family)